MIGYWLLFETYFSLVEEADFVPQKAELTNKADDVSLFLKAFPIKADGRGTV
jgi:hypothetical protein